MSKYGLGEVGDGTGLYRPVYETIPLESTVVRRIVKEIKACYPEAVMIKVHGNPYQRSGVPDLYVAIKGKSIWIEIKREGADTTALQRAMLVKLRDMGVPCGTAESPQTALDIIKKVLAL